MTYLLLVVACLSLTAADASAQSGATAVAITHTPVYVAPDASRTPLRVAAQGTVFTVVAEQGEWTQVQFRDPQWGVRVGYVATRALQFRRPELEPMDLSTTPADEPTAERPAVQRPKPEHRVPADEAQAPRPWERQTSSFERGWIDVNLGVAIATDRTFFLEYADTLFRERRTSRVTYRNPTGASFDFGGGAMITPEIGVGVSIVGTAHRAAPELFVSVPHPNFFDAFGNDTTDADREFWRREGSINLQLVGVSELDDNVRLRVFGGPSYFRVEQDLVSNIRYAQVFGVFTRVDEIAIASYDHVENVEGTGWGYHVGADLSVFFTRVVGVGGFARFSRGTVTLVNPLGDQDVELKAGGWQAGGGLRLKF